MRYLTILALAFTTTAAAELPAEEALCSHWECVCFCSAGSDPLRNPETGDFFFYPGGSKGECAGHNGSRCIGHIGHGRLFGCEWTLVPDSDGDAKECAAATMPMFSSQE